MNQKMRENVSKEASNRFDRGEMNGRTPEEESVLNEYSIIRRVLKTYKPISIDRNALSTAMQMEMVQSGERNSLWNIPWLRPAFALGLSAVICSCLYANFLGKPSDPAVIKIQSTPKPAISLGTSNWLWERLLQNGFKVTTPSQHQTNLTLTDGSKIECYPGTRISVNYSKERRITLDAGEITVHAAHIEGSTMTVETPYMKVQVVGTVFRLKVVE